jgi:hypothetical protein
VKDRILIGREGFRVILTEGFRVVSLGLGRIKVNYGVEFGGWDGFDL